MTCTCFQEVWEYVVSDNIPAPGPFDPFSLTDTEFGNGKMQATAFSIAEDEGAMMFIGGDYIPQGTGVESYPHWVWHNATEVGVHNMQVCEATGTVPVDLITMRANR